MKRTAFLILALAVLSSCSDEQSGTGVSSPDRGINIDPDASLPFIDTGADEPDTGPPPTPEPTCLGQPMSCCQTQYWYCAESFQGDELWLPCCLHWLE